MLEHLLTHDPNLKVADWGFRTAAMHWEGTGESTLSLLFPRNSTTVVDMDILTSTAARLDAVEFDMLWNRAIPTGTEIT
jgi:hypothetical protein